MVGYVTPAVYDASFTPGSVAEFRATCFAAAQALLSRGIQPRDLAVANDVVEVPRSFLGFKRKPTYQAQERVILQGWELREVRTLMGHSGDEWYQWTVTAALGADGVLYRVERHREERNGVPTSENGRVIVTTLEDRDLPLFDVLDPESFGHRAPDGYWGVFPRKLTTGLDGLCV